MGKITRVYLASFGHKHSSHYRRVWSFVSGGVEVIHNSDPCDRNSHTILERFFRFGYLRVLWFIATVPSRSIVWCWGPDINWLAVFVRILRPSLKVVWDVSDLHPSFLGRSHFSQALRKVDLWASQKTTRIVLTSPGFASYFDTVNLPKGHFCLIENKVLPHDHLASRTPPLDQPMVVVYAGIFRSQRLLEIIKNVALALGTKIQFHLHGRIDRRIDPAFFEGLRLAQNIVYFGPYQEAVDLNSIYTSAHLVFGLVDVSADPNESALLTNRIYHAQSFGVPLVTTIGTACAEKLLSIGLGWAIENTERALSELLIQLLKENFLEYRQKLENMPNRKLAFLGTEFADLAIRLDHK